MTSYPYLVIDQNIQVAVCNKSKPDKNGNKTNNENLSILTKYNKSWSK